MTAKISKFRAQRLVCPEYCQCSRWQRYKKWVVQTRSFTLGHRAWPHALQNNTNTKMGAQFTSTGVGTWPQVTSTRVGTYNFLIKYVSRDRKCVSKDNQVTIACIPQKAIDELHCANWVHFRALSTISNPLNYTADTNWCLAAKQWTTKRSKYGHLCVRKDYW